MPPKEDIGRSLGPARSPDRQQSLRDDERRHLARELHDGTSQALVALQLHLGRLRALGVPEAEPLISECEQVIAEVRAHIRDLGVD